DVKREFPDAIIHRCRSGAPVYMTARFVLEACLAFNECFNARGARRRLSALYSSALLDEARRSLREGRAPLGISWHISTMPGCAALRSVMLKGFAGFVDARVRQRQLLCKGRGVRVDGCYKLAHIIYDSDGHVSRPCTAVIGFCGALLTPLLRDIRVCGLQAGLALDETLPVFHSTDVRNGHWLQLAKLHSKIWGNLGIRAVARTPKGPATSAQQGAGPRCVIARDPVNDTIILKKATRHMCGDASDLKYDRIDLVTRLSGEGRPDEPRPAPQPALLSAGAKRLLRDVAVAGSAQAGALIRAQPQAAREVRALLEARRAWRSDVWEEKFGAKPPRGTLARLARRFQACLRRLKGPHGWKSLKSLKREAQRIEAWYKPGRKTTTLRRGIWRASRPALVRKPGAKTAWTAKVQRHCRLLRKKLRLEGLWRWRPVARTFHLAGIPLQSGTVPVERLRSVSESMVPHAARAISLPWWQLLSMLSFLRNTFRHFNEHALPTWNEGDSLLAERVNSVVTLARALHPEHGSESAALTALQDAFA
ncbi:unnamed protein product, partial [Prorocentrum cordatum]